MDDHQLAVYMYEVRRQGIAAVEEVIRLNHLVTTEGSSAQQIIIAAQGVTAAAVGLQRLLYPQPQKRKADLKYLSDYAVDRGIQLRQTLGLEATSALQAVDVRNSLEHFDERLDKYMLERDASGRPDPYPDFFVGPVAKMLTVNGVPVRGVRHYDSQTKLLYAFDDVIDIQILIDEMANVLWKTEQWLIAHGDLEPDNRYFKRPTPNVAPGVNHPPG